MHNKNMGDIFTRKRKPKNLFELIYYKIWYAVGISPSWLMMYLYKSGDD